MQPRILSRPDFELLDIQQLHQMTALRTGVMDRTAKVEERAANGVGDVGNWRQQSFIYVP